MKPSVLAALSLLAATGAYAQAEAGLCGQPQALTASELSFDSPIVDPIGQFITLSRNEPQYIELSTKADMDIQIEIDTSRADTTLILFDSAGEVVEANDDGGNGKNARLAVALAQGEYCLQVGSIGQLDAIERPIPLLLSSPSPGGNCSTGAREPYAIDEGAEPFFSSGQLAGIQQYPVRIAAGYGVRIDARSAVFDTMLSVEDRLGNEVASNDDGGDGTNSLITLLPMDRDVTYCVTLRPLDSGEGGQYSFSLTPVEGNL